MHSTVRLLVLGITLSISSIAVCDQPTPPTEKGEYWSKDHKILVVSNPDTNVTSVFRVASDHTQTKLWSMAGWYRDVHVSRDGDHLVIGTDGLIPQNYRRDMPMIRFVNKGQVISVLKRQDILKDFSKLTRTVSHFIWGDVIGFNTDNQLVVTTVDGEHIFDVNGKLLASHPSPSATAPSTRTAPANATTIPPK